MTRAVLLFLLFGALAGCSSSVQAPARPTPAPTGLTKVTVGGTGALSDAGVYIAIEKGYFKELGLDVEFRRFNSGADQIASLNSGQLDIAGGATSLALYNAVVRGADFKMVATRGTTEGPESDFVALAVRKDLIDSQRVEQLANLKGLTVASAGIGSTTEVALFTALRGGGIDCSPISCSPSEVTYIAMGLGEMPAAFANHSVDAAMAAEPFLTLMQRDGTAVRWKGNSEVMGRSQQLGVILYSQRFAANTEVARSWMVAYLKALRDYNDAFGPAAKRHEEIANILVKNTSVKDKALYGQMRPARLDPDGKLDVDYLHWEACDYYRKCDTVDLSKLIDSSFQEFAASRLGPYTP